MEGFVSTYLLPMTGVVRASLTWMPEIAAHGGMLGNSPVFAIVLYESDRESGFSDVGMTVHPAVTRTIAKAASSDPELRGSVGDLIMEWESI